MTWSAGPDVTIIIAVRNAAAELDETLKSIEQQAVDPGRVEVVVVDGASTDGTADVARRSPVPALVVSEPDDGIYDAMNKGARLAAGTWLHFLNAGDLFATESVLGDVLDALARTRAAGRDWFVAGARYRGGRIDGQRIANVPHRWWAHAYGLQPHCHQATWFRREAFESFGGHSVTHSFVGDFDLILRFGLAGAPGQTQHIAVSYLAGGLSAQRAAEVPALLKQVREERLQLRGRRLLRDDLIDRGVRGITWARRGWWWLRAAVLYAPKRILRRSLLVPSS